MRRRAADGWAVLALLALEVLLYRKVVRLWWTFDDTQLLHTILEYGLRDEFFSRAVWPQQLFTPLMYAAFEGEWALFGFEPLRWYWVHLAAMFVAVTALYAALRHFLAVVPAWAATAVFLAGAPLCSLVTQLSTIHYFLAIAFGAGSVIAFAKERPRVSGLLYFAALLAKEIAVPLPLVLVFLPVRERRERIVALSGHAVALVVYLVWRRIVIGAFLGAYSWSIEPSEWPRLLLLLPWNIIRVLAGANVMLGLVSVAVLVAVVAIRGRGWLLAAGVIAAAGPLLPLAKEIHPRYPVMPWLVLAIAFAAAAATIEGPLRTALVLAGVFLAIGMNRQEWSHQFRDRLRMSNEGRFFMEMRPEDVCRKPLTPPPNLRELAWLKTNYLHRPAGSYCFYDDLFLCDANRIRNHPVFEYDEARRTTVAITERIPAIAREFCSSIREAPLSATFRYHRDVLRWELGPYAEGRYSVLIFEGIEAYQVPRTGALNLSGTNGFDVRVRYDSPQGWTTYSPVIVLDFLRRPDVTWRR